jgi:hydroxymethylbilane synthase
MKNQFVIGSRGSELALWQANFVKRHLEIAYPESVFEIKTINTKGDELVDVALSKIGDKGLFTKQIETELLDGGIDFAVHSLKDLQTAQSDGLMIGAVCKRELPNDVFISRNYDSIAELAIGASVATGSLRRKCQLLGYRPDLKVVEIRGNVPTRLQKFDASEVDGLILAYAGLHRLGLDSRVSELIPFDIMLPAVGQGAIAVEVRVGDEETAKLTTFLDDTETRICVTAERSFLRTLEGGCQVPIGAIAILEGDRIRLEGMVGSVDGTVILRDRIKGGIDAAEEIGVDLARRLIDKGGADLLAQTRSEAAAASDWVM